MTQKGLEEKTALLKRKLEIDLKEATRKVREAAEKGDLSENAEYSVAREELAQLNDEIQELDYAVHHYIIDEHANDYFTVRFEDTEENTRFFLVPTSEADMFKNRIPRDGVLARALTDAADAGIKNHIPVKPDHGDAYFVTIIDTNYSKSVETPKED